MQVGSGAMAISATPNAVCLAASDFEGPGLSHCIAGERAEFIIQVHPDSICAPGSAPCGALRSSLAKEMPCTAALSGRCQIREKR